MLVLPDFLGDRKSAKILTVADLEKGLDAATRANRLNPTFRNISEVVGGRLRHFEYKVHVNTAETLKKVQPFLDDLRGLDPVSKVKVTRSLYNGNFNEALSFMPESMKQNFNIVKSTLDDLYNDSQKAGIVFDKIENYFPRQVKDLGKFRDSLGMEDLSRLSQLENDYAKRLGLSTANDLSLAERSYVANQYARGFGLKAEGGPRFAKQRKISNLIYNSLGKPVLKLNKFISISHSLNILVLAVSKNEIGVDIEKERKKIYHFLKIRNKVQADKV